MKEGPSLSSRAQGGVLCAPKNKITKYYEIRRQGKTKLSLKYFKNKLKFSLKKREITRLAHSLALACLFFSCSLFVRPTPNRPSPITSINLNTELLNVVTHVSDQPLLPSIDRRQSHTISSQVQVFVTVLSPKRSSNFKFLKRRKQSVLTSRLSPSLVGNLCRQVSSFAIVNQQTMMMPLLVN
jgi:hypothetical protein